MFHQNTEKQTIQTPQNPTRSIGTKYIIIPQHITKIVYREGEGYCAKSGASIKTYYSCHTIDGQQIIKKRPIPKRFSIGLGRLIEGLQIVFLTVKKNEKFVVFISPEYAYRNVQIDEDVGMEIGGIPVNNKLVFQFQVLSIDYFGFSEKSQADILVEVRDKYREATNLVEAKQYNKAIKIIDNLYERVQLMKYYKTDIKMLLLMKKTHIYFIQQKYLEALKQTESIFTVESTNPHFLTLITKIHIKLKNYSLATTYMNKLHQLYNSNLQLRRVYVQFLKELGDIDALKKLEGYNYEKDQVFQIKTHHHHVNSGYMMAERRNNFSHGGFGFFY